MPGDSHRSAPTQICLVPRLNGLGGMVSFQARLVQGLAQHGVLTSFNLADPANSAMLVIGGTRHLVEVWRARQRGVRIVQRLNGMNWLHRQQKTSLRQYLRAEGNNLLLAFIRRWIAQRIVYQSRFSYEWWQREYGALKTPYQVTYNGIDLAQFSPQGAQQPPADRLRLLLVEGHLGGDNLQGLENAVALAEKLQTAYHLAVELTVVGNVPQAIKNQYQPRAGGAITWAGVVGREQIPEIDRSAHLLFSADLNAACPNAVIEALACGLPVVSFDTGALSELLQDGAGKVAPYGSNYWKLEPPDLAPLAEAAVQILTHNPIFRQAARAHAETVFGLDSMVTAYLAALLG
jgi:glycosyltransferase involved in cell wall biosynthesis